MLKYIQMLYVSSLKKAHIINWDVPIPVLLSDKKYVKSIGQLIESLVYGGLLKLFIW